MTVVHQHMVLNFVSAIYYCENKHWPADVAAVHAFQDELKITLPVPPDWTLIESRLAYSVSEDTGEMTVHSEKDIVPDAHPVTSTNQTPVCTGKNIEMRPHLNIGE
ncbi:hypothetical protein LF41_2275 [Lysobacter dokdonensis DS-58]|uniref:Uncharacterized protein n=2 Tax=Noviluteimonas TaxID=3382693 RepID=A0A0A2WIY8_9GAMM|nr:hypothetical protein LF41_2275 [Lysobacter dokdonensis DS-58]